MRRQRRARRLPVRAKSLRDALDGLVLVKWACSPHGNVADWTSQGCGYLVLQDWALRQRPSSNCPADDDPTSHWAAAQERALEVELTGDDVDHGQLDVAAVQVQQPGATERTKPHVYEYHVVHSASYGVPVLYFRGNQLGALTASLCLCSPLPQPLR